MTDEPAKPTIRDQAEEVSLRVAQAEDLIKKRTGKIAVEMLAIMHHRLGILRKAEETMWWLATHADALKAFMGVGEPSEPEPPAAPEQPAPEMPAQQTFWIDGVLCNEMGDPIPQGEPN